MGVLAANCAVYELPSVSVFGVTTTTVGIVEPDLSTEILSLDLTSAPADSIYELRAMFSAVDSSGGTKGIWLGTPGNFQRIGASPGSGDWIVEGAIVVDGSGDLHGYGISPANGAAVDLGTLSPDRVYLLAAGATVPWAYMRQVA